MKIIIRPLKVHALQEKLSAANRYYVHSHMASGGKTHCQKTGVSVVGEYKGTQQAKDHRQTAKLELERVEKGPFITVAYD